MKRDKKEKILFVDDEKDILELASEYFQLMGYEVFTAQNGLEALDILAVEHIDCCFTDINMPEMNGLELAEEIHKNDNTMPVIIMTGYPSLDNTIRTLKNGVVDFLIKPVNLNQMEVCVRRVLHERELFIENLLLKKEIERAQRLEALNSELMYKVEELRIINKIMNDFSSISSTTDVFKRAVDMAMEITRAEESGFFVVNDAVARPFEVVLKSIHVNNEDQRAQRRSGEADEAGDRDDTEGTVTTLERLIKEVVADEVPLIIPENNGRQELPDEYLSLMIAPLKIRGRIFGILTAAVEKGDVRFAEKDLYFLAFITRYAAQAIENLALYENINENLFSTLYAFVEALDARDAYTKQHSIRVANISIALGRELNLSQEDIDILYFAGHLHDIGKIGIRDDILLKSDRLTGPEFGKIKEHPIIGGKIVGQLGLWDKEQRIIRCHHEHYDGSGYPDGLEKNEIPFLARILSVADVYDAMASGRTYRAGMDMGEIAETIEAGAGNRFDPVIVEAFLNLYRQGALLQYMESSTD
jgi:putative nucleotidyltransferase with HDIG domain